MIALLVKFWRPLAAVVAVLAVWGLLAHREHIAFQRGYQQATSEDAKALAGWKIKYDAQVKSDEDRIASAWRQHEIEVAQLAVARARPVDHIVCHHASNPGSVPAATGVRESPPSDAGVVSRAAPESFDPTDNLVKLADAGDDLLANCRQLNQEVHGVPTAP